MLLERDGELEVLEGALDRAARAAGSVVLVSGEAGIGKTSLVRAFLRAAAHRATVLQGACDDLLSPRTLGPLRDAARTRGGPLAAALADGARDAVLAAALTELGGARPTVLVLEDVHWADATLDVLRYVGRRVDELAAVIVVTVRDGEVGRSLQRVLGGPSVRRLALARRPRPLTPTKPSRRSRDGESSFSARRVAILDAALPCWLGRWASREPRLAVCKTETRRPGNGDSPG